MKVNEKLPPREFSVGVDQDIVIKDCGTLELAENEMVTFVTDGKHYDFVAKDWGFYATPSINGRLKNEGFKSALVRNKSGRYFLLVVDTNKLKSFENYLEIEAQELVEWLDER